MKSLRELWWKYDRGTPISRVRSAPEGLAGKGLRGRPVLLVPEQEAGFIPREVLELAERLDVEIHDVNGRVYSL